MLRYTIVSVLIPLLMATFLISCESDIEHSWDRIPLAGAEGFLVSSVHFLDEEQGMLVASQSGRSRIYGTADGGATWDLNHETDYTLHDLGLISDQIIVAVGNGGILRSSDFGSTWKYGEIDAGEPLMAVDFSSPNHGFAVGRNGTILHTSDGGAQWTIRESGSTSFLKEVSYIDEHTAVAAGSGAAILYTEDSGRSWISLDSGHDEDFLAVHFRDTKNGCAVGRNGILLHTTDGGTTWTRRTSHSEGLLAVKFHGETGMAVGFGGSILKTVDGGETWELTGDSGEHLYDLHLFDAESVILVGDNGTVLRKK